jgi:F420-0:gamma-glutamyl ligase
MRTGLLYDTLPLIMQYIPIKTRVMSPPEDDLYSVLDESVTDLQEGDLVLVTSKVVAIGQGKCIPIDSIEKRELVEQESEYLIEGHPKYQSSPLSIKYGALFFAAGIDESNANGHYIPLPDNPYEEAREIWEYLRKQHSIEKLGVIITDSHSVPLRAGCSGISIGFWGMHPVTDHVGKKDLFGYEMQYSSTSIVDTVAAGAAAVCGETAESTPIVIARAVPNVRFTEEDTREEILISGEDDLYYPLLKPFYE